MIVIADCPLAMKRNITKQLLRVRGSVWDSNSIRAGIAEEEIQKHMRLTQYQFWVFKNVDCFMSLRRCYLDKAVTLFHNSTMQCYKGNVGCCLIQNTRIRDLQWQHLIFYQLLFWVTAVQSGLSWQPNRPPRCTPELGWNLFVSSNLLSPKQPCYAVCYQFPQATIQQSHAPYLKVAFTPNPYPNTESNL